MILLLCFTVTVACSYSPWAFAATMAYSFAGMFFLPINLLTMQHAHILETSTV